MKTLSTIFFVFLFVTTSIAQPEQPSIQKDTAYSFDSVL